MLHSAASACSCSAMLRGRARAPITSALAAPSATRSPAPRRERARQRTPRMHVASTVDANGISELAGGASYMSSVGILRRVERIVPSES